MPILLEPLTSTVNQLIREFDCIPDARIALLNQLTLFVNNRRRSGGKANLNFICTHNSRRSHLSQIWAQTAAYYYSVPDVHCFSGGTEATAFNPKAVKAMSDAGFSIVKINEEANPTYEVKYSLTAPGITAFSKKYDDSINPDKEFAAIMTCSHADENCPLIVGASARIPLTYDDPKDFDGTPLEVQKYKERTYEIGRELLFALSRMK